jgi:replicative DNA helicase
MIPSAPEVERAVLGAVLVDVGMIPKAIDLLREEHFYEPRHRTI